LTSCATYRAKPLENLPQESLQKVSSGLSIGHKKLNFSECRTYLGDKFTSKSLDAVQLTFENRTSKKFLFNTNTLSLPTVTSNFVLVKVRYSPVGRFLAYTIVMPLSGAGLAAVVDPVTGPIIIIPLELVGIFAGVGDAALALKADACMKKDYLKKAPEIYTINSHETSSMLFFVKKSDYEENFSFTLKEERSGELKKVSL
jgi:hypothetical protein